MRKKSPISFLISLLLIIILGSPQCKKDVDELSKLPPVTQNGERTFGCLVNGKAWMPENGNIIITDPALDFVYENSNGGLFYITAKRTILSKNIDQGILFGLDSCTAERRYLYNNSPAQPVRFCFSNYNQDQCRTLFSLENDVSTSGFVAITRFDLSEGIISGTFEFTLSKSGCETIRITDGRFDGKL